jgi:hypothetical protein
MCCLALLFGFAAHPMPSARLRHPCIHVLHIYINPTTTVLLPIPRAPLLQLHLPGMSTSASFDDLLHQLMMAERTLSTSL